MARTSALLALAAASCFALSVQAQETTVKSQTKVKTDDAKAITLNGCLQSGPDAGTWTLSNIIRPPATDKKTVGTTGTVTSYVLAPKDGVDLTAHVGHRVEITALEIAAKTATDDDAKIEVKDKTKVKRENMPDEKTQTKTKAEIERGPMPKLTVLTVKHIAPACM
jgi:hypothetical protein